MASDSQTTAWSDWLQELDLAIGERAVDIDLEYEDRGLEAGDDPVGSARLDEVRRMREVLLRFVPQILGACKQ